MTVAWLFPGQGAETARMGLAVADAYPEAAALLDHASRVLDRDVRLLLARGGRALEQTEILQPVLTAVSLGAAAALSASGLAPAIVAGHSLGEVAALAVAGLLTPEGAIELAAERGRLMAEATARAPGGMIAVTGAAARDAAFACGGAAGTIAVAAQNAPEEWVLSGDDAALRAVVASVPCTRLRVAGPWHSPAMAPAAAALRDAVGRWGRYPARVHLVLSTTGELAPELDPIVLVAESLMRPLRWTLALSTLAARQVDTIVTCGPGKVLASLCRRTLGAGVRVLASDTPADIAGVRKALA